MCFNNKWCALLKANDYVPFIWLIGLWSMLTDAAAAGLDARAMAALFEMPLRDFHAAGAGAVA